jgi:type 1 glutamine amidotransferase
MHRSRRLLATVLCCVAALALTVPTHAGARAPHVLVYSGTQGFRHLSIAHGKAVLAEQARAGAFTAEFIEDPGKLTAKRLSRADVVVWLSSTGTASPFSAAQEKAYVAWLRCGGGHVGIHASTDSWKDWPAWVEVTGAFFAGHPLTPGSISDDQFKDPNGQVVEGQLEPEATINVAARKHPATAPWRGAASFTHPDEYYYYDRDPAKVMDDYRPLLTFGGFTNPADAAMWGNNYAEDMPVAWTGSFRGRNRTFYTDLGHGIDTWNWPAYVKHVVAGIKWTAAAPAPKGC